MKKLLLYFFLLCWIAGISQNKIIDSLTNILLITKNDTSKVLLYNTLSLEQLNAGDYKKATFMNERAFHLADSLHFTAGIINCMINKGWMTDLQNNYTSAQEFNFKALNIATQCHDLKRVIRCYTNIGTVFRKKADFPSAIEYHIKALNLSEEIKYPEGMALSYTNIGVIYGSLKLDYAKAIAYINKAIEIAKDLPRKELLSDCYNHLGSIYFKLNDLKKAEGYFKDQLKISESLNLRLKIAASYGCLGAVNRKMQHYESALEYYKKELMISEEVNNKESCARAFYQMGDVYTLLKKNKEALACFNNTIRLATEIGDPQDLQFGYEGLQVVYYNTGSFEKAFEALERFKQISDSIFNVEKSGQISELEIKYQTEKKEKENNALSQKNEIQTLQLNQNKFLLAGLSGLMLLLLLFAYLFFRQNKFKNQQREMLLEQKLLRTQMNPHFIFNSLQAIQNFILKNDQKEAVKYLGSFANITRSVLDNSRMDVISLKKEINLLQNYLHLQKLRFGARFEYQIHVDPTIDIESIELPPMLSQPFIENALEHGMRDIESGGKIDIYFTIKDNTLLFEIIDNGNGIQTNDASVKEHRSLALTITKERVELMNKRTSRKTIFNIMDAFPDQERKGVKVQFSIPV